ncbi:hypothetical protein [Geoalkalibacter subterraneus]|uniref:DHHA1 domain-containing protein n=1 Tax=Geoalkalibacter subterraneus TaxID=483547 RepID=A0A0B5FUI8_9BACT|nr:hypothetical protein [Geoalkalibacter subterraneus]AJF08309.1 hypothetical protein GSUB_17715 [Geoalkalibacter subterraneus]
MLTVLYHNDADGFGAAYAVWKSIKGPQKRSQASFIPVQHGQDLPRIDGRTKDLVIVDFCFDLETLLEFNDRFRVLVVDHHRSSREILEAFVRAGGRAVFDERHSGAILVWQYFFKNDKVPEVLQYVEDRDLWKFQLPASREVNLYIESIPFDFNLWDSFDLYKARLAGESIRFFQSKQIKKDVENMREIFFEGHRAALVNCSANTSEVGNEILKSNWDIEISVMYCDRPGGFRDYSLRSRPGGVDVASICRRFGGGGHVCSAGFSVSGVKDPVFEENTSTKKGECAPCL